MAQPISASVFNPINNVTQKQLVVPDEYLQDEDDQEVRREKYFERYVCELDLNCSICFEIPDPRKFFTGHCGASICTGCLESAFFIQPNRCPSCNTPNVRKECFCINRHGKKMIEETLKATCAFDCGTIDTVRGIIEHQNHMCPLRTVVCPTCREQYIMKDEEKHRQTICTTTCRDCNEKVLVSMMAQHVQDTCFQICSCCIMEQPSRNMLNHMNNECMKRLYTCACNKVMVFDTYGKHKDTECPKVLVECPDCKCFIMRGEMSHHSSEICPEKLLTCELCQYMCTRNEMPAHKAQNFIHWEKFILDQQKVNNDTEQEMKIHRETTLNMFKFLEQSLGVITSIVQRIEYTEEDTLKVDVRTLRDVYKDVVFLMQQNSHYTPKPVELSFQEESVCKLPQQIEFNFKPYTLGVFPNKFCSVCPQGLKQLIPLIFGKHYGYEHSALLCDDPNKPITMCLKCMAMRHTDVKKAMDEMHLQNSMNELSTTAVTRLKELRSVAKPAHAAASFISARTFCGQLQGYVFKTDSQGTGYYIDTFVSLNVQSIVKQPVVKFTTPPYFMIGQTTSLHPIIVGQPVVYKYNYDQLKGCPVRRGPKWNHYNEDDHGIGIIRNILTAPSNHLDMYFAEIEWKNGYKNDHYRIDRESHELEFA